MHQSNQMKTRKLMCVMLICLIVMIVSGYFFIQLVRQKSLMSIVCILIVCIALLILNRIKNEYQKLKYGIKGEKEIYRYLAHTLKKGFVLKNVHLIVDRKELEIDTLVIDKKGICIIEVKNYRGKLIGHEKDEYWTQEKILKNGNVEKKMVKNSLLQLERQKRLLASYLRQKKIFCSIDGCVYIQIDQNEVKSSSIIGQKEQLVQYISQRNGKSLTYLQMKKIKKLFK